MLIQQLLNTKHLMASFLLSLISLLVAALLPASSYANNSEACPNWLNETFRKLHSTEQINLCNAFAGKPLLLVNTASHCGFTHQFSGLEALHKRYKDKGLTVVGFASDDFRQAAESEEKAASICYLNYGVSFTMMSPISVTGDKAHPLFKELAKQTQAPSWNFTKFVISSDGKSITHFDTSTEPSSPKLQAAIEAVL